MMGTPGWDSLGMSVVQVLAAIVLALPIGWERERAARSAGLRTFPLVASASCVYVLIGIGIGGSSADAQARIVQGLMTGIGFVGGGAILKQRSQVRGTATAASIWMTGALGAAVAYRRWELALLVSVVTLGILHVLTAFEKRAGASRGSRAGGLRFLDQPADLPPPH